MPQKRLPPRVMRLNLLQSNFMGDVVKFLAADVIEMLSAGLELFVDLDGLFGHLLVRVLSAANEREIIALGNALVAGSGHRPPHERHQGSYADGRRLHRCAAL